jgi:integrase
MVERAAVAADLGIKANAHMLRHACGYKLANDGSIRVRCKPISVTAISRTPRATLRLRPIASKDFGKISLYSRIWAI